jgi:trans-2,3-dihydro-3-hydroxyanthranilate isomerase
LSYHLLDVFTDQPFGGNPLAVVPDGRDLSPAQMQRIARELNLSETVFVLPPETGGARRIRIFTPAVELPFAGHPTLGAAFLLATLGVTGAAGRPDTLVLEEGAGPVAVEITREAGRPIFARLTAAQLPEYHPAPPPERIAAMLSLSSNDLLGAPYLPEVVSCGLLYLLVPLRDRVAVARARLDPTHWQRDFAGTPAQSVYLFALDAELPGSDVRARMFAPAVGVAEDPATGSAAAPLAAYLATRDPAPDGALRWTIEQGFEIGRPSLLYAEADKRGGAVIATRVGGAAVIIGEGRMYFA